MDYAPGIRKFIDRCDAAMPPDFYTQPLDRQRELYLGLTKVFPYAMPAGVSTEDLTIEHGGRAVAARVYRPDRTVDDALVIYLRGGGFVVGSLETHNTVCAELCANTGLTTVAIDFCMAPERPFPAALEDCYAALCGIAARPDRLGIDPAKIVISGDSSGANMAVCVAMMARDRGGPALRGQSLISPVLDFTRWRSGGGDAPLLTGGEMRYYTVCYLPDAGLVDDPYVSPLVRGRFDRLPPAYVMGAELDPLLVDARAYVRHLRDNGTPVTLAEEPGLVHSAMRARGLSPQVADAWRRLCVATARLAAPSKVSAVPAFSQARPVVIVHPYSSGATYAPAFADSGVPVVALVAPTTPEVYAASYRPEEFHDIIVADDDLTATVERLRELRPRCVLAGCESGVELAESVAPLVVPELANRPETATARRHKGAMAAAVARAGLWVIEQICTDDPDAVEAWIERAGLGGWDLVVKPPKSASTDGVTRVPRGDGWRRVFLELLGRKNRLGIRNDDLVVQEYCVGTEFVVDTASWDGRHSVCDVCRYRKVDNGSYMAVYESMDWMPPGFPGYDDLVSYARAVLDAVGVRYGAAHAEIMLTDRGPRLIEVAARPHGGGHPRFCRVATGDSQVDRVVRRIASGASLPEGYTLRRQVRVVFLMARRPGYVRNAEVLDGIRELESHFFSKIALRNGVRVEPTRDLFGSFDLGFVVLAHTDLAQVEADARRVRELEGQIELDE
jgi:acetyl esterase/lipase/biotin carboxylase